MRALPDVVYESLYRQRPGHHKRIYLPIQVELSTGIRVTVPKGFVTDLGSVPRLFWGIVSPSGRHDLAVIVHDYLLAEGWHRKAADREMLFLLRASGVSRIKCGVMYYPVFCYGAVATLRGK